jgi:hypothetical protein
LKKTFVHIVIIEIYWHIVGAGIAIACRFTATSVMYIRRIAMLNGRALLAVVGGLILTVTFLLYAANSLVSLSPEIAFNGMVVGAVIALCAFTVYEDWRDAKQARERSKRR